MLKKILVLLCIVATAASLCACEEIFYSTPVIKLEKSSEIAEVIMPDLHGKTLAEANKNALTYKIKAIEKYSKDVSKGQIFEQSIKPGDEVSPGAIVEVYVSKGAKYTQIPYVSDFEYHVAKTVLESLGFEVKVVYEGKKGSCDDSIISVSPNEGENVIYGSVITIRANALEPNKRKTVTTEPVVRNGTLPITSKTTY